MYKFVMQGIENVAIWPIIALILFLLVFAGGVLFAITASKRYIHHMENLPLEEEGNADLFIENKKTHG